MTQDRWAGLWQVYESAAELPPDQREPFVRSALPDPEAAAKVLAMLADLDGAPEEQHVTRDSAGAIPLREIPKQLQPGDVVGRFTVTRLLGCGGMGEVYAAEDPELGRSVALKLMRTEGIGTRGALEKFIEEARAASALNHPGIVTIHEVLRAEPSLAIVMEMVEGASLRELVGKPNAVAQLVSWGRQIAQALKAAHARGIIHRDIKPENVMLREDGLVKVLDFGLARRISEDVLDEVPLGTLGYMSPEQVRGSRLTGATDIFSMGVVLYELSTGKHPFLASSASETTRAIAMLDPGSVSLSNEVRLRDASMNALVHGMLAKDPMQRPDAAAVATQLDKIGHQLERRGPLLKLAAVLAVLVALAVTAGVWITRNRAPEFKPPKVTQFTNLDGSEMLPAFSPDGKRIAFSWNGQDGENQDIYYKEIGEENPVRLTADESDDSHPAWSPNGQWIAFVRTLPSENQPWVVIVPAAGGEERRIGRMLDPGGFRGLLSWWPDSKSLIVRDDFNGAIGLVRLDLASGRKTPLTSPRGAASDGFQTASPDGKTIAFVRQPFGGKNSQICLLLASGGAERCVLTTPEIIGLTWWNKGRSLVYAQRGSIWRVPLNGDSAGTPVKVAEGDFQSLAGDAQGLRLAGERRFSDANIWRAGLGGKRNVKLISSSSYESDADISPDGESIVFRSERTGSYELWVAGKDGSHPTRLTHFGGELGSARWSPDGNTIVFDGFRPSFDKKVTKANIYVVSSKGGGTRRLTDDRYMHIVPNWSRDGKWIYFIREEGSHWETWKVPSQGGQTVRVSTTGMFDIAESADGKYLYYTNPRGAKGIWRRAVDGGPEEQLPGTANVQQYRYWHSGPRGIFFVEGPLNPAVQLLPPGARRATRLPAALEGFHKGGRGLAVSPDGNLIVYTKDEVKQSDLFLIEGIE